LPRYFKDAPDLSESRSYLLGWLAGYFAADGSVNKAGQATIESASIGSLQLVRDVCYLLGVDSSPIQSRKRMGIHGRVAELHRVSLRGSDLPDSFWLKTAHATRRAGKGYKGRSGWTVVSVEDFGEVEEVFCAEVPSTEKFVLADNLVTGNCPYTQTYIASEMRWKHGLYGNTIRRRKPRRATARRGR